MPFTYGSPTLRLPTYPRINERTVAQRSVEDGFLTAGSCAARARASSPAL
jgi:hypothetical protein